MKHIRNLTSKGQVTIPKDIRDALGLTPGGKVWFEIDSDGDVRLCKPDDEAERQRNRDERLERLKEVQRVFRAQDPFDAMDGLEYQRWIRESPEV